jgi:hypothetical protein
MALEPVTAGIELIGKVIDKIIPDKGAADQAKLKLLELAQSGELAEFNRRSDIVQAEAASANWLAASWRPITMLTFVALIVARWFGYAAPELTESEYLKLWDIVELGLGGYVVGRSVEKIAPALAGALAKR